MDKFMQYDAVLLDAPLAHQFDNDSCILSCILMDDDGGLLMQYDDI